MAGQITGKLVADFTAFQTAVKQAEVSLKDMETGASKVQTSLNRMVDSFSGRKIMQDATLAAEAVERIGGATKLTEAEQKKLNATVTEAIAKYKALGQEAPESLQKIQRETDQIPPKLTAMQKAADIAKSSFGQMFGAFTAANLVSGALTSIVSGLKNLATSAIEGAGEIVDMANSTGLSIQTLQKFQGVAEQSGVSVDTLTRSVFKLTTTLAKGSPEAKEAVDDLGLSFEDLSRSSPDQAFDKIIAALEKMPPNFDRNLAMQRLFGKGASEVAKLVADKYSEMAGSIATSTDEQIIALDKAGDAWVRFKRTATTSVTGFLGELVLAGEQAMKTPFWKLVMSGSMVGFEKTIAGLAAMNVAAGKAPKDVNLPLEVPATDEYKKKLAEIQVAFKNLTATQKTQIADAKAIGQSAKEIAEGYGLSEDAVQLYITALDKLTESTKKAKTEWEAYIAAALKAGAAEIAGQKKRAEAIENVNHQMTLFVSKHLKDFGEAQQKILSGSGDAAVRLSLDWAGLHPVIAGVGKDFMELSATGIRAMGTLKDAIAALPETFEMAVGRIQTTVKQWLDISTADIARAFGPRVADAMGQFQQFSADTFKAVSGLARVMAGDFSGFVDLIVGGINSIKTQWKLMIGLFNQREGRHAVEDFAASFGGFDALHDQLLKLGDAGEQLWIKLTQGTAAGNADAAARVIAEIEEALGKQADAADEVTAATEEQAQATIETASQAAKALEELGPRLTENEGQWRHWGDIVTAQIQAIADGLRSLPMLPGAAAMGGMALAGAGAGGGSTSLHNRTTIELDGVVVGEAVARQVLRP